MGQPSPSRVIGQLCRDLNTFTDRIEACKAHAWYLDELMPPRGEQRDEFDALKHHIQWMYDALATLNENTIEAYRLVEHHERVPHPLPLARQHESEVHKAPQSSNMQATRSGTDIPAIGNPEMRATA